MWLNQDYATAYCRYIEDLGEAEWTLLSGLWIRLFVVRAALRRQRERPWKRHILIVRDENRRFFLYSGERNFNFLEKTKTGSSSYRNRRKRDKTNRERERERERERNRRRGRELGATTAFHPLESLTEEESQTRL